MTPDLNPEVGNALRNPHFATARDVPDLPPFLALAAISRGQARPSASKKEKTKRC